MPARAAKNGGLMGTIQPGEVRIAGHFTFNSRRMPDSLMW
jgi:hypothetical protein